LVDLNHQLATNSLQTTTDPDLAALDDLGQPIVTKQYHEVDFAHRLGMWAWLQSSNGTYVNANIGPRGPEANYTVAINRWIGKLPTKNIYGQIIENGYGLLGNRFISGTTSRSPGFYATDTGYLYYVVQDTTTLQKSWSPGILFRGPKGEDGEQGIQGLPGSHRRMIVTPIKELSNLTEVVKTMLEDGPAICETFDHHTYDLAERLYPQDAERANVARGKHMVIFSIYEGESQQQADTIAGAAKEALEAKGHDTYWIDDKDVIESFLLIRRKSFGMLLEHPTPNTRAEAFLEDTIVPLENYGEFLRELEGIIADYKLIYTYAGHIGHGSIRLIPLMDMEAEGAAELLMELNTKVNELVVRYKGSISVDHNDGIIRTPYLEMQFGPEMVKLFDVEHIGH
jgi:hypothetical protein